MKVLNFLLINSFLMIGVSCVRKASSQSEENPKTFVISGKEDQVAKKTYFDFLIPDTLILNKKSRGKIRYYSILEDSIRTSKEDLRFLYACLDFDTTKSSQDELLKQYLKLPCDTLKEYSENFKDTIVKSFYITPKVVGEHYVKGILNDHMYLEAYGNYKNTDSSTSRITNAKYCFQFKVFVKE